MIDQFDYSLDYNPNSIDSDEFISEIPVQLMKENIKAQFEDPLELRKRDQITPFLTMYTYSKDNVDAYEDEDIDNVMELRDDFYAFMQQMFRDYLGIGFVNFDDMSLTDQDELIHYTYRFFIMNIRRNFMGLIMRYIHDHSNEYSSDVDKAKDITTLSFKREVTDPVDVYIISNIHSIIESVLSQDLDVDEFLSQCDDDETLETSFVREKYDENIITGNFFENYVRMLDDDFISNLESKVRNKILKKYRKIK